MSYLAEISRSVVRYEPSHKASLRAFQRAHFGPSTRHSSDAFSEWLFERNPHRDPAGYSLWLCMRDGEVVGQQASMPVVLKVGEREIRAAWLIDWMIHPAWRLRGVALALLNTSANANSVMLGLGLEDVAYKTVARAGWKDVERLSLFVRPLDAAACARGLDLPAVLGTLAPRTLVGGSARVVSRLASALRRVTLEPVSAFDERVDTVWAAVAPEHPILVKRDYASVRWRYDDGPFRERYLRYYFTHAGRAVGFAVLRLGSWRGQAVGRVVDYLVERKSLAAAFALMIDELNSKGVIAVLFEQWHPGSETLLRALGCMRVRPSHRLMYKLADSSSALDSRLSQAQDWFIMPGDSDFDNVLIES